MHAKIILHISDFTEDGRNAIHERKASGSNWCFLEKRHILKNVYDSIVGIRAIENDGEHFDPKFDFVELFQIKDNSFETYFK